VSAREQIFALADAVLAAVVEPDDGEYERQPSGDPSRFPALDLFDGGERSIEEEAGTSRKEMSVTVGGYVKGGSGAAAHTALNDLHARVVKALMGDAELNSLVELIEPADLRIDVAELASQRRLAFAQDFIIQYATERGDPSQFA
jgi:hypothetical protein